MGQMLTVSQVAEVKGCGVRYIQQSIKSGKLQAKETLNDKNRKTYLVPLEALDEELQQKWYQMNLENPPENVKALEPIPEKKAVDHFSESERQEIDFWIGLVEQWQQYRMKPGVTCKAEVDKRFVALCGLEYPDREISIDILYRKWKAVKEKDLDGLMRYSLVTCCVGCWKSNFTRQCMIILTIIWKKSCRWIIPWRPGLSRSTKSIPL